MKKQKSYFLVNLMILLGMQGLWVLPIKASGGPLENEEYLPPETSSSLVTPSSALANNKSEEVFSCNTRQPYVQVVNFQPLLDLPLAKGDVVFLDFDETVFWITTGKITDSRLPTIIKTLQNKGVHVFILTLRSGKSENIATELKKSDISLEIEKKEKHFILEQAFYDEGVIYTAAENKGLIATQFLNQQKMTPNYIAFVDDVRANLDNMDEYLFQRYKNRQHFKLLQSVFVAFIQRDISKRLVLYELWLYLEDRCAEDLTYSANRGIDLTMFPPDMDVKRCLIKKIQKNQLNIKCKKV